MHNDTTRLLGLTGLAVVRVEDAPHDDPVATPCWLGRLA